MPDTPNLLALAQRAARSPDGSTVRRELAELLTPTFVVELLVAKAAAEATVGAAGMLDAIRADLAAAGYEYRADGVNPEPCRRDEVQSIVRGLLIYKRGVAELEQRLATAEAAREEAEADRDAYKTDRAKWQTRTLLAEADTARLRDWLKARAQHNENCTAYRTVGRFGSRSGLLWSKGDEARCNCGLGGALATPAPASVLEVVRTALRAAHRFTGLTALTDEWVNARVELRDALDACERVGLVD